MRKSRKTYSLLGHLGAALGGALLAGTFSGHSHAQSSNQYNIDPNGISVSGISSGADLAHQLHVAHSALIHGVGLLAASSYYCGKATRFAV